MSTDAILAIAGFVLLVLAYYFGFLNWLGEWMMSLLA